ncbi:hypothetical protein GWK47_043463 [Chionoecetes opilio]|uniref:Uncharacterized protein n=1 Tax=Chionoecetes opilio TaxID=41210 RepID=A0A8J5CVX0_CHIOP|nr:hypothetical protein GWK47_043463 [Chionoecetes opilio]
MKGLFDGHSNPSLFKLSFVRLLNPNEKVDPGEIKTVVEPQNRLSWTPQKAAAQMKTKRMIFFNALMSPGPIATEGTNFTRLSKKRGKSLRVDVQRSRGTSCWSCSLHFFVRWVDVLVKYSTAIPSSAAVERLLSHGADIMKAKRGV